MPSAETITFAFCIHVKPTLLELPCAFRYRAEKSLTSDELLSVKSYFRINFSGNPSAISESNQQVETTLYFGCTSTVSSELPTCAGIRMIRYLKPMSKQSYLDTILCVPKLGVLDADH